MSVHICAGAAGPFRFLTSSILEEKLSPGSIAIIGSVYSGSGFAAILNVFGYDVTLIEEQQNLLPQHFSEIGVTVEKYLRLDGVNVITGQPGLRKNR